MERQRPNNIYRTHGFIGESSCLAIGEINIQMLVKIMEGTEKTRHKHLSPPYTPFFLMRSYDVNVRHGNMYQISG